VQGFRRAERLPGQGMSQRLTLLFGDRIERVSSERDQPRAIGDELEVAGRRWVVIGLLWTEGEERLLCRPVKDADRPLSREQAWWSTEWR
jgi:hypothetical protein